METITEEEETESMMREHVKSFGRSLNEMCAHTHIKKNLNVHIFLAWYMNCISIGIHVYYRKNEC